LNAAGDKVRVNWSNNSATALCWQRGSATDETLYVAHV